MDKQNDLWIAKNLYIESLPFVLGQGLVIRGLRRQNGILSAWVVNEENEGTWWTFDQIREWWALEQSYQWSES